MNGQRGNGLAKFSFATEEGDFDQHIRQSIRGYDDLHNDVVKLSEYFVDEGTTVLDIGCSTGTLLKDIKEYISQYNCEWIVWSGGEPTDQLTEEIVDYFKFRDCYKQAIETSGIRQPPNNLDWVVLSPKIAEHAILKKWMIRRNVGVHCDELRWVRKHKQEIPNTKILAHKYYISPHFDGDQINSKNTEWCIELCLENPKWFLSVQQHKLWQIR